MASFTGHRLDPTNVGDSVSHFQTPLGQRMLKLRAAQESLLDTVWPSTATVQIRQLWQNVTDLLVSRFEAAPDRRQQPAGAEAPVAAIFVSQVPLSQVRCCSRRSPPPGCSGGDER